MNRKLVFCVAVMLQLMVLGWMVAAKERALSTGARVVLAVAPVDPIDHLSGRYIRINPEIARIDTDAAPLVRGDAGEGPGAVVPRAAPLAGRTVFVELAPAGDVWRAARVLVEGCGLPPRAPFLRARVTSHDGAWLRVDYDLERFYLPSDGHDPSLLVRDPAHSVRILVCAPGDGVGVIEDLLVDGRPFKEWDAAERAKGR